MRDVLNNEYLAQFYLLCALSFMHALNPLVPELFCQKIDLLEIVSFSCKFLQNAAC